MDEPVKVSQWEKDGPKESRKQFRERLLAENEARVVPWPVCKKCRRPVQSDELHWLFTRRCDTHGIQRLEDLVARIAKKFGRKAAIRILKSLARGG